MSLPNVIEVHPSVPARTVAELIAYAKANPGRVNMATAGVGTSPHVSGELFKMMTGTNMVHVPYRGAAPALTDLIAGQVEVMFDNLPSSVEHIRGGKIRALGVTTAKRADALPDVPSIGETVPGYEANVFYGIAAPKGTPSEIVGKLHQAVDVVLADPRAKARFAELGGVLDAHGACSLWRARCRRDREMGQGGEFRGDQAGVIGNVHGACRRRQLEGSAEHMLSEQEHAWTDRRGHGDLRKGLRLEAEIDELTGVIELFSEARSDCQHRHRCRNNVVTGLHGRGNQL